MKIAQINVTGNGSTGRIMCQISAKAKEEGFDTVAYFGRGAAPRGEGRYEKIDGDLHIYLHVLKARLFDKTGHGSVGATKKLVALLKTENPDIIHLHNIHGYYLNIKIIFDYLKTSGKKVVWTLHDCWAMTGGCAYFLNAGCDKWKTGCFGCPSKNQYPKSFVDKSKREYAFKKDTFTGVKDMILTTPSDWLHELVKESFLKDYETVTVHNGIDVDKFGPQGAEKDLETKKKYGIDENTKIILGVASVWDDRKRLNMMVALADKLKDENVQVVTVGLSQAQADALPKNVLGITRTENIDELVNLYSAAEVFVSTSVEESFSLVVGEAMATGTPIVCVDGGGCKELISDEIGIVVPRDDIEKLTSSVKALLGKKSEMTAACRERCINNYSQTKMVDGYMKVYKEIYGR